MVECKEIDLNSQEMDKSGHYVKIKVDFVTRRIGVQVCNAYHSELEVFWGRQAQDICYAIFYDPRAQVWFTDMTHMAYVGRETKKAEIALAIGGSYYQE